MKKTKLGLMGSSVLKEALRIVSSFEDIEFSALFDTNKHRLADADITLAEHGIYIKRINNSDDFYALNHDIILADGKMCEYAFFKNTYFLSPPDEAPEGAGTAINGKLHIFKNGDWEPFDFSIFGPATKLKHIKNGQAPMYAYFLFRKANFTE